MAFIRNKNEERTGYQTGSFLVPSVDNKCDFVMVYRLDDTTAQRIEQFRKAGYVIHHMTGISWGHYTDYLDGEYDGRSHWDEAQTDRYGNMILHSVRVPYMVPTVSFADYITEKLKAVVDAGVEAIHVEEPEFWDRAGYSEAFKREYRTYYREEWRAPHESVDARYKCAKLKAYLYTRTIDRVSSALKEYSLTKYNKELRFYVPTHSLLNYTQWKIISPEGKLADIPGVDGCIAQVWTGTSREKNWFNGEFRERTFETAYLEYGVMQELVKGTGRTMWFLHDPIEDMPNYDWNDYRKNYLCTVAASLLHPKVNKYEICPWPNRVFEEKYPKGQPDAEPIPGDYAAVLNNMFNTLGTIENTESENSPRIGILMGDCQLYQREYPDSEYSTAAEEEVGTVLRDSDDLINDFKTKLFASDKDERELHLRFMSGNAFPGFYGLALPLLKYGIGVRPVLLDNARRYAGYLDDYDVLLLSYEFMKPDSPDINSTLSEWVKNGGTLIYIGDGNDPYHRINSWWTGKYPNAAEHLFKMLGIAPKAEKEIFNCLDGIAAVWKKDPASFCYSKENADSLRGFVNEVLEKKSIRLEYKNHLSLKRDRYIIAAVMDESINEEPLRFSGIFADMFAPDFAIREDVSLNANDKCMLCDLSLIKEDTAVIGTSVRINSLSQKDEKIVLNVEGADGFTANIRIKLPFVPESVKKDGVPCRFAFDEKSKTVLISFGSVNKASEIIIE